MTRTVIGLSLVMAFGLASLGAQTGTSTPASSASDRENITVTGCLQKDASGGYVLTNAHIDKTTIPGASSTTSSSSATSGTTGTAGTSASSSSSMGVTFKLEGSAAELDKHVGHKIQVTGKEGPSTPPSLPALRDRSCLLRVTGGKNVLPNGAMDIKAEPWLGST